MTNACTAKVPDDPPDCDIMNTGTGPHWRTAAKATGNGGNWTALTTAAVQLTASTA